MGETCAFISDDFFRQGNYIRPLGTGSYGHVDLFENFQGRQYAIKTQPYRNYGGEYGIIPSSLIESDILVRLQDSPSFVHLNGICTNEDKLIIVMEPLTVSLADLVLKHKIGPKSRLAMFPKLLSDLVRAGSILEQLNIGHYDIKPENILLKWPDTTKQPDFKLIDFGISRMQVPEVNFNKEIVTLNYRSPELLAGRDRNTFELSKVDVWSIGMFLLTFLNGQNPFDQIYDPRELLNQFGLSPRDVKEGKVSGSYPIGSHPEILQSMLMYNPLERISSTELAHRLGLRVILPRPFPEPEVRTTRDIDELFSLERWSVPFMLTAIEIRGRLPTKIEGYMDEEVLLTAARIASVYIQDNPLTIIEVCNRTRRKSPQEIEKLEKFILHQIQFQVYNSRLTEKIVELFKVFDSSFDIIRYLKSLPFGYFDRPISEWFKETKCPTFA